MARYGPEIYNLLSAVISNRPSVNELIRSDFYRSLKDAATRFDAPRPSFKGYLPPAEERGLPFEFGRWREVT